MRVGLTGRALLGKEERQELKDKMLFKRTPAILTALALSISLLFALSANTLAARSFTCSSVAAYSGEPCAEVNGNVPEFVKTAVSDCLTQGIRNNGYLNFRSGNRNGTSVPIGGNWYF